MYVQFTVQGAPCGKARARTVRSAATGRTVSYTPEKTAAYEDLVRAEYLAQCKNEYLGEKTEIDVTIDAYYKIPERVNNWQRAQMERDMARPTKKPDCDNIAKIILDALNGIAYRDDAQVVTLRVGKRYSLEPRVEVRLEVVG